MLGPSGNHSKKAWPCRLPHVLERERERPFWCLCAVWWRGVRGTSNISKIWPTPPFCPVADCPRYPGGPSAVEFFYTANRLKLPLVKSAQHRRTVRGPLADCPQCISEVENFSAEPLVDKSNEWRTVRALPADCLQYQISDCPELCQLSQFQPQFGIIAHI